MTKITLVRVLVVLSIVFVMGTASVILIESDAGDEAATKAPAAFLH